MSLNPQLLKSILKAQQNEMTEHILYLKLKKVIKGEKNQKVLENISADELKHYEFWKKYTKKDIKPNKWMLFKYYYLSRIFGFTFGIKLMEKGEKQAQINYDNFSKDIPEISQIIEDENKHEQELISMLKEDKLRYIGSVVLGLNDALVELTAALAGFTFAMQNTHLIAVAGLITGFAASLSMAASEYLSHRTDERGQSASKSAIYTGIAYVCTVAFLITPYFLFHNYFLALAVTLINGILIILYIFKNKHTKRPLKIL